MMLKAAAAILLYSAACLYADDGQLKSREPLPQNGGSEYRLDQGKRIPVKLLNTVSLGPGVRGDHVNMRTVFPMVVSGQIVIPSGSYLDAQVTEVHRAGRAKDRAEVEVRLNQLTFPNRDHRLLHGALASINAATTVHGSEIVVVPGTVTELLLQDPLVFPVEQVNNR